jgi:hypothetical protein
METVNIAELPGSKSVVDMLHAKVKAFNTRPWVGLSANAILHRLLSQKEEEGNRRQTGCGRLEPDGHDQAR